ncbi:hypothetical protein AGOR_G00189600 [Albula goreensis]|uniref:GB1/RHD3-type G domain-containing protein n=1 Tax=Albula goreensis TaxID=1534307 RepID=A0A8T3CUH9_9TELE|nr:hypothetical protein AGOR_G00189600 [Albula goreensis]
MSQEGSVEMQKPVCLIDSESTGELQVNQEALNILSAIRQPVVVVSIVGMYHTGKSYLMNRLAGKQTGYLDVVCASPCKNDHTLVLLDTEGLGDVEKQLFLNKCNSYVTELTEHIKVKSSLEKEEERASNFTRFFPAFVWTVRDFTLELKIGGKEVTADEYLENSLQLMKGNSPQASFGNKPRECIRNYFPSRRCFVFYQPAQREKLQIIDQLTDKDLEPAFVKQTEEFCSYVFNQSKAKTITGEVTATGQMLGNLAAAYVEAIQSGSVPCLENAVLALSQIENKKAVEQSHALYRQLQGERVKLPTETQEELSRVHEGCLKEALEFFMKRSFKDEDQVYQKDLMERIKDEYDGKCSENALQSQTHCTALLQQLWSKLDHESFMRPGGYTDYRVQVDSITQTYKGTPGKGVQADQALEIFVKEKSDLGASILSADKNLTEQERRVKEEEARAEMERFKAEVAKREQEDTMKRLEDTEKAHRENERQLMERMERERKAALEENQRVLDQRLKEQRALMQEGFESRSKMMEAQIQSLRQEVAASRNSGGGGGCVLL